MKDKKPFVIQLAVGAVLICGGLLTRFDYYSTMLLAMGCGLAFGSIAQIARIAYWQNPKREAEYAEKKQEAYINSVDERKQYLRMKAGYVAYQIMTVCLLIIAAILALFRAEAWVIGMIFLLFVFQWAVGIVAYRILEKRM